ncbi:MAG: hypothetical protein LBN26_03225 [Christensenellaceae bacterium]|jgi:hypothetical protein|nr:hypothetical protein [Christensenellaceae bacterium]
MTDKDRSIEYILDHGLVKPKTAREQARDILRTFGFKFIFWDMAFSLIFAAITIVVVLAVFVAVPENYRYSATVAVAPLLYLLVSVFTETEERASGLYELKQTCRYTTRQITAFRTACYSVAGAGYTAVVAWMGARGALEFMTMYPLGLLALFTCAVPQLTLTRYARHRWANALYAAVWVFVNLALPLRLGENWEKTLAGIPAAVSLGIAVAGAAISAYQIKKMLTEVQAYARA